MKRIAVGVDGSPAGAAALRWAAMVAEATGADLVALGAIGHQTSESPSDNRDELMAEQAAAMNERWLPEAGLEADAVTTVVETGDPREVLPNAAIEAGADLLVLGRSGAGGPPGFLHLGSVVEHLAHHAPLPLAVVPADWVGPTLRVVAGVDGSDASLAALRWAGETAGGLGAKLLAVQVAEPYLEWTPADSPDNWRRGVERDLEGWTAELTASGLEVEPIAARDLRPADGLVGVAAARYADLMVIGTRGVGGFGGLRIGGVAMKVLHRCGVPLVLVPER
jgi:nucleotide-binding universal stress UspA family protein